jgi:hypothetical protein
MVAATYAYATLPNTAARLARLRWMARLMDAQFGLPGTRFRFGVDALIGLAPGVGDVVTGLLSLYVVWEAWRLGAPNPLLARMLGNVAIEVVGGAIPVLGDLFDAAFKANLRNVALLEDWMARGR